jgi:hypothetical protein
MIRLALAAFAAFAAFAQVPTAAPSIALVPTASSGAYPTIATALASTNAPNDTLVFACSGLSVIPALAAANCPGPVVLQSLPDPVPAVCGDPLPPASAACPMWAATVTVGLTGSFAHISLSETCVPNEPCGMAASGNRVVTCTAPCEIDSQAPVSGEYAVAVATFDLQNGTLFTPPASRWNGYLTPVVVTTPGSNCGPGTLSTGVTWTQTPWQVLISCQ